MGTGFSLLQYHTLSQFLAVEFESQFGRNVASVKFIIFISICLSLCSLTRLKLLIQFIFDRLISQVRLVSLDQSL